MGADGGVTGLGGVTGEGAVTGLGALAVELAVGALWVLGVLALWTLGDEADWAPGLADWLIVTAGRRVVVSSALAIMKPPARTDRPRAPATAQVVGDLGNCDIFMSFLVTPLGRVGGSP